MNYEKSDNIVCSKLAILIIIRKYENIFDISIFLRLNIL